MTGAIDATRLEGVRFSPLLSFGPRGRGARPRHNFSRTMARSGELRTRAAHLRRANSARRTRRRSRDKSTLHRFDYAPRRRVIFAVDGRGEMNRAILSKCQTRVANWTRCAASCLQVHRVARRTPRKVVSFRDGLDPRRQRKKTRASTNVTGRRRPPRQTRRRPRHRRVHICPDDYGEPEVTEIASSWNYLDASPRSRTPPWWKSTSRVRARRGRELSLMPTRRQRRLDARPVLCCRASPRGRCSTKGGGTPPHSSTTPRRLRGRRRVDAAPARWF